MNIHDIGAINEYAFVEANFCFLFSNLFHNRRRFLSRHWPRAGSSGHRDGWVRAVGGPPSPSARGVLRAGSQQRPLISPGIESNDFTGVI